MLAIAAVWRYGGYQYSQGYDARDTKATLDQAVATSNAQANALVPVLARPHHSDEHVDVLVPGKIMNVANNETVADKLGAVVHRADFRSKPSGGGN